MASCSRCYKPNDDLNFKTCSGCREAAREYRCEHPEEVAASRKRWVDNNPEKAAIIKLEQKNDIRLRREKLHSEVINHYGGKCVCCGETEVIFLTIDHINGGGRQERRERKWSSGTSIYKYIIESNFPNRFQILCANCNFSIGFYGYCPHSPGTTTRERHLSINRAAVRERDRRRSARLQVLAAYGNCCFCCGENSFEFLAIDHSDGTGSKHRSEIGINAITFWIIENNFPQNRFRLLCHNCHKAITLYDKCCHNNILVCNNAQTD